MAFRNQLQFLIGIFILICAPSCIADEDTWYEVKSPNFTIVSNGSIKDARQVARAFEQFRAAIHITLPTLKVDPGFPLIVFATRDQLSLNALLPDDRHEEGATQHAGVFLPGQGRNTVLLRMDARGENEYHVMYHEYVHMVMNLNFQHLPLWLFEGLAEFYAFATISDKASGVGRTSRKFLEMLKTSSMIPLPALMAVTPDSPYYTQQNKSEVFYAQSWALTHYLILGDKGAHAKQLLDFFRLIKSDTSELEAVRRSFGDLNALQQNLEQYVRSDKFYYVPIEKKLIAEDKGYAARKLSMAESLALRGEVLLRTSRLDEARRFLEQALRLDSRNAAAHEGMGLLFLGLRNLEQSQKHFSAAADLDSRSFLAQYYAAELAYETSKDYKAAESYLRKALAINPDFAPTYRFLSHILLLEGARLSEALELATKAANLEPAESSHWINVGQILVVMGRIDEAKGLGERLLAKARTETESRQAKSLISLISNYQNQKIEAKRRAEALWEETRAAEQRRNATGELKTPLGNQALTLPAPEIESGADEKVAGFIRLVTCAYPAIMDVVLDSNGEQRRLHAENYYQVQYWIGESPEGEDFQPCKHLEGMRAQIEYLRVSGQEYSGVIKRITIER